MQHTSSKSRTNNSRFIRSVNFRMKFSNNYTFQKSVLYLHCVSVKQIWQKVPVFKSQKVIAPWRFDSDKIEQSPHKMQFLAHFQSNNGANLQQGETNCNEDAM